MDMNQGIDRLRESKQAEEREDEKQGEAAGMAWATNHAEHRELKRLSNARDPQHDWSFGVGESAYSAGENFYFTINPGQDGDRAAAEEFWTFAIGKDTTPAADPAFVQGFAIGALSVFDQV